MSESEQASGTPEPSIVGDAMKNVELARSVVPDAMKLADLANVREAAKTAGLAGLHDSTRLAGLARLSLDATKVAALDDLREATKVAPAKFAAIANFKDATKVAGLADLQKRFEEAGVTTASVKDQARRLDRITSQVANVERFERDQRTFDAMKARRRIDNELRDLSLRQARRAAEIEAAQLGTLDQLVALNVGVEAVNARLDAVNERLDVVTGRLDAANEEAVGQNSRLDGLLGFARDQGYATLLIVFLAGAGVMLALLAIVAN